MYLPLWYKTLVCHLVIIIAVYRMYKVSLLICKKKQTNNKKKKNKNKVDWLILHSLVWDTLFSRKSFSLFAILAQCLLRLVENGKRNWERPQKAVDSGLTENIEYLKQHYVLTASESCWWHNQCLVTVWTVSLLYLPSVGQITVVHTCLLQHAHHIGVGVMSSICRKHLNDIWQTVTHQGFVFTTVALHQNDNFYITNHFVSFFRLKATLW